MRGRGFCAPTEPCPQADFRSSVNVGFGPGCGDVFAPVRPAVLVALAGGGRTSPSGMSNIPSRINSSWYFFTVVGAQRDCAAPSTALGYLPWLMSRREISSTRRLALARCCSLKPISHSWPVPETSFADPAVKSRPCPLVHGDVENRPRGRGHRRRDRPDATSAGARFTSVHPAPRVTSAPTAS
jgi:hypothetical protein